MKLSNSIGSFLVLAAMAIPFAGAAQNQVDIGLFRSGDKLELRVKPNSDFSGIFSSLVFTIRWDGSSGAGLGQIRQEGPPALYMPIVKSGAVHEHGNLNYQVYAGFGISPLESFDVAWQAGKEVVLATIPVTGKGEFELVNDAWTGEASHNADYYVSLGGRDETGVIYKGLATAEEDGSVTILPNPNNGQFVFFFTVSTPTDITVEIVNALGQSVFNETLRGFEGNYRKEMDLTSMSNGVYYLKLKRNGESSTHKIVYR